MAISKIEYDKKEVKKWNEKAAGLTMKELVKATGIGETSLRSALLHSWGSEETRLALNKFAATYKSKKQHA